MTKKDFESKHKAIESIIDKWSYIEDEMKLRYKQRIDFILKKDDVHQMFYEFYHKLEIRPLSMSVKELDRKKNNDIKKIDGLSKQIAKLEVNKDEFLLEKDEYLQTFNALNQKLLKFDVKLDRKQTSA
jgi:hypothetical protein